MASQNKEKFPLGLDFFSLFIHELKSPLISFKFQLDELKSELQSSQNQKKIDNLQIDIHRLFQFIEDGIHMKKLEDPLELQKDWALWSDTVNESLCSLKEWISHKEIIVHCEEKTPLKVHADSRWIQVVISNLLLNAIQHSPQKSSLWLKTELDENHNLLFSIKDEGLGVDEKLKDKLFHRFHTARPATASYMKGTGLGLYIVRSLVEKHGGQVGVDSSQQSGCTFYILLPQAQKTVSQQAS